MNIFFKITNKKAQIVFYTLFIIFLGACSSEHDFSFLDFDINHAIDFGALDSDDLLSVGVREYAMLSSEDSTRESTRQLQVLLRDIDKQIYKLEELNAQLSDARDEYKQWAKELRDRHESPLRVLIDRAADSSITIAQLSQRLENEVNNKGSFVIFLEKWRLWVQGKDHNFAQGIFAQESEKLKRLFEQLYKQSVVFAQTVPQESALEQIALINHALEDMHTFFEKNPSGTQAERSIKNAETKLSKLRKSIEIMTQKTLVHPSLLPSLADLNSALDQLKNHFVNKVAKSYINQLYNDMRKASGQLLSVVNSYAHNEKFKAAPRELMPLIEEAFSGSLVLATSLALDLQFKRNDLIKLIDLLKENSIVGLKRAEDSRELMKALGFAVGQKIAAKEGLTLSGVVGINDRSLNKVKYDFGLTASEFNAYIITRAQKTFAYYSAKADFPYIYVIFADELSSDVDVKKVIQAYVQSTDKVIVVANKPEDYSAVSYVAEGLSLSSAFYVARAVVKARYPEIVDVDTKIVPLIKIFYGLSTPGKMNLVSLPLAVEELILKIIQNTDPVKAAIEVLGAMKDPIPVHLVKRSGIVSDSLRTIQQEMNKDPTFYLGK
jgi:hypothetical protein